MNFSIPRKNLIYYKVRITESNFTHTHHLSTTFYKRLIYVNKGSSKMDITAFKYALELLKVDPRLGNGALRKLLYNMIPLGFHFSSDFLRNFKLRAAIYHANNPDTSSIKTRQCQKMLSQNNFEPQEIEIIKDPLKFMNLEKNYNTTINSDVTTWKVLSYLQQLVLIR